MSAEDRRIRSLRPSLERPSDARHPLGVLVEDERLPEDTVRSATVFLVGAECPFTCAFCDLWRHTLPAATPLGAIPAQLAAALDGLEAGVSQLKLYNASNFFEPRAVPDGDREEIARRLEPFARVVVESHPRLLGARAGWWADRLGSRLEVALGLETVHPAVVLWMNKGTGPGDLERAARRTRELGVGLRCFVLVGLPFVAPGEQPLWVRRAVARAADLGARVCSLIPLRGGNGELERLARSGEWRPPSLALLEDCLDAALELDRGAAGGMVVQADPWDLEPLADCRRCAAARCARIRAINASGAGRPRVDCRCGEAER